MYTAKFKTSFKKVSINRDVKMFFTLPINYYFAHLLK